MAKITKKEMLEILKEYQSLQKEISRMDKRKKELSKKILSIMKDKREAVIGDKKVMIVEKESVKVNVSKLFHTVKQSSVFLTLVSPNMSAVRAYFKNKIPEDIVEETTVTKYPQVSNV